MARALIGSGIAASTMQVHVPLSIVLAGSDVDTANLTYTITAAPKIAKLTTFDTGTRIAQGARLWVAEAAGRTSDDACLWGPLAFLF